MISIGVVLVLLLGEIDLSVGAVSGLARRGHGGAERQARLGADPGDRRRRSRSAPAIGLLNGFFVTRFGIPSFVVTLAGLLAWQGALLLVLGDTGTVNLTDATIIDLPARSTATPSAGSLAVVVVGAYAAVGLARTRCAAARAGLAAAVADAASSSGWSLVAAGTIAAVARAATPTAASRSPG